MRLNLISKFNVCLRVFGRPKYGESHTYFEPTRLKRVQKGTSDLQLICPYSDPKKDSMTPPNGVQLPTLIQVGVEALLSESSGAFCISRCGSSSVGARTLRRGKGSRRQLRSRIIEQELSCGGPKPCSLPHADQWEARRYTGDITLPACMPRVNCSTCP
jgi:hypothetical protein